jgi:hypothetical protein
MRPISRIDVATRVARPVLNSRRRGALISLCPWRLAPSYTRIDATFHCSWPITITPAVLATVLAPRRLVHARSASGPRPTSGVHLLHCQKPYLIILRGLGLYNNFYEVLGRVRVGAGTMRNQSFVAPRSSVPRLSHACRRSVHTFAVSVVGYDRYLLLNPPFTGAGPFPLIVSENPTGIAQSASRFQHSEEGVIDCSWESSPTTCGSSRAQAIPSTVAGTCEEVGSRSATIPIDQRSRGHGFCRRCWLV